MQAYQSTLISHSKEFEHEQMLDEFMARGAPSHVDEDYWHMMPSQPFELYRRFMSQKRRTSFSKLSASDERRMRGSRKQHPRSAMDGSETYRIKHFAHELDHMFERSGLPMTAEGFEHFFSVQEQPVNESYLTKLVVRAQPERLRVFRSWEVPASHVYDVDALLMRVFRFPSSMQGGYLRDPWGRYPHYSGQDMDSRY